MTQPRSRSTTILAIMHQGRVVFASDGQVTVENTIMKHGANKIRKLRDGAVLAAFAGAVADCLTLYERFEAKLNEFGGQLGRAAVELAKDWRCDRYLRRLSATMIVGDREQLFLLTGSGDVIQPDDGVLASGSGGNYALCAARALLRKAGDRLSARDIAESAMAIAAEICPFTNDHFVFEEVESG